MFIGLRRSALAGTLLVVMIAVAYAGRMRSWQLRWGATPAEHRQRRRGDELIPHATSCATRAVTIDAPIGQVWPWVAQVGQGRGGFYSYDWLENLLGCDIHSADRVHAEWQQPAPGDVVRLAADQRYPESYLLVEEVDPPHVLLLRSENIAPDRRPAPGTFANTWLFDLEPRGARTRLIARTHYSGPRPLVWLMEMLQFVMERRMLRGVAQRAERARCRIEDP